MADEVKEDVAQEAAKIVCYKLLSDLGNSKAGELVYLPEDKGNALVEAGLAEHAAEEDVSGGEEAPADEPTDAVEETPMIANSVNRLGKRIEKTIADATAKAMNKIKTNKPVDNPVATVPATPKSNEAIYKSAGHYVRGIFKAMQGDNAERNKVHAYQEQAADKWRKLGIGEGNDLVVKSPLGINETTNSQGGYLVNPEFSDDVYVIPHTQIDLRAMTVQVDAKSNTYNQRYINETSLANGSIFGGLEMYATAEGNSYTSSLPAWGNVSTVLQKNTVFIYYTVEILQDASYPIEAELNEYIAKTFLYGINTAVIQGFGSITGLLNETALVTVTSSANDTDYHVNPAGVLTWADVSAIWSAVYPDSQVSDKGMWLFHPGLQQAITQMTYTFNGTTPAWGLQFDGQDGLKGRGPMTPYMLMGKPAYPCWAMSAPGNAGDIMYVDFNAVKTYRKPFRIEVSKEFQFGTDQIAVRAADRCNIFNLFRNKVQGVTGTGYFSNIVTRSGGLT